MVFSSFLRLKTDPQRGGKLVDHPPVCCLLVKLNSLAQGKRRRGKCIQNAAQAGKRLKK
jgi:hypothetical protein